MNSFSKMYFRTLLKEVHKLPADVSCSFLISQQNKLPAILENEEGSFCEKCACPWIAGHQNLHLLAPPRKSSYIKRLNKLSQMKRISRRQKLSLSLHESGQNALVSECKVCKGEMVKKFILPRLKVKKLEPSVVIDKSKLKKMKKKKRDKNAGLIVPPELLNKKKLKRKDKNEVEDEELNSKVELDNDDDNNNNQPKKSVQRKKMNFVFGAAVGPEKYRPSDREKNQAKKIQQLIEMDKNRRKRESAVNSFLGSLI